MAKSTPVFHVKHPCAPVEPTRRGAPSMRPMPRGKRPVQAMRETSGRRRRRGSAPPACHWHVAGSDSPPQSAKRGRKSSRKGWDPANHCDGVYPGGKGDDQKKGWGLTSHTATPPRRRTAAARGRLAGAHGLIIVERAPRHRALPTRAHRRARAPRTTLAPPSRSLSRRASARPVRARAKQGAAKRRRRTRCSTRKPDREAPAHECFT